MYVCVQVKGSCASPCSHSGTKLMRLCPLQHVAQKVVLGSVPSQLEGQEDTETCIGEGVGGSGTSIEMAHPIFHSTSNSKFGDIV